MLNARRWRNKALSNWSKSSYITDSLRKKWTKGDILREFIVVTDLFPLKINLKTPTNEELSLKYSEVLKWIKELKEHEKSEVGYGYDIVEKEVNYRNIGRNSLPNHVIIETLDDAIRLLREGTAVKVFCRNSKILLDQWVCLKDWVLKYPHKVVDKIGNDCDKIISVLKWFEENPEHYIYLREIGIKGIDTKFIEKNKSILEELLLLILPEEQINLESRTFEEKFNLRQKPVPIRFRVLDSNIVQSSFSDMSVPVQEFLKWNPNFENVFVTENEINFLSFPSVKNSCVIFGKGYGVDIFKNVEWLKDKNVYYWGDIDTHGFNILSIARGFLPNLKSFLMTEDVLIEHNEFWVKEDKQYLAKIENLTIEEHQVVTRLQDDFYGVDVRLEQERIDFKYVEEFISGLDIG